MTHNRQPEAIQWHAVPLETVISNLQTDTASGLARAEATNRIIVYGKNELPRGHTTTWWEMLFRQFKSPLVYILVIAAIFTAWLKEWIDTTVILLSVAVNTIIGFYQEYRASDLLEKLKKIVRIQALVMRDGQVRPIDAVELVPGDIIELKIGMKVPADARLIMARHLETGEAILTGESAPVKKSTDLVSPDASIGDRANMVWMGTVVEQGEGLALVVGTANRSEIGKIAALAMNETEETTPLQERLGKLANTISIMVGISAVIIFVVGLLDNLPPIEGFKYAVAVAVAAIPEGLVAALSVVLAVSTSRILKNKGLVRRPVAAETLGSTTVICTDKTGTLTEGVMKVEHLITSGSESDSLLSMALANEALLATEDGKVTIHGESTDRAKLDYALMRGLKWPEIIAAYPRVAMLPFDSSLKYIASFHSVRGSEASVRCFVSGAAEVILNHATQRSEGGELDEKTKLQILSEHDKFAASGYRVIGLADRFITEPLNIDDDTALRAVVSNLTFRGLLAIRDPIRNDVPTTLKATRRAGVRVIMVTGDHRSTAAAIGRELGFRTGPQNIIDGVQLDATSDDALILAMRDIDICVRVNPEHKLRIVKALLAGGEAAVAMTGDGINDAPALKAADIGVAVGSATDVTKEAADLVLLDDGFTTIVSAIREGRVAFDNIKKVTVLLLSGSFTAFLMVMASLVLGLPLPMSPVQILWANLVENGLPNFALAFEPGEPDVMDRPPVNRSAPILDAAGKWIVFGVALLRDFLLIGVFFWFLNYTDYELTHVRTIVFALLSTDSLFYIFSIKSFHQPLWRENFFDNWFLLGSIGLGAVMVVAAVYLPVFNWFLGTVRLSMFDVVVVVGIAMLDVVLIEIVKAFYRYHVDASPAVEVS